MEDPDGACGTRGVKALFEDEWKEGEAKFAIVVWLIYGVLKLFGGKINGLLSLGLYFVVGIFVASLVAGVTNYLIQQLLASICTKIKASAALTYSLSIPLTVLKIVVVIITANIYLGLIQGGASTNESGLPTQFEDDRFAFVTSVTALNRSRDLTQPPGNTPFSLSEDAEAAALSLAAEGITSSNSVSDEFLDYLHPELGVMYRQKLVAGSEMWSEGVRMGSGVSGVEKQVSGNALVKEWIDWFAVHGRSFDDKIF